MNNRQYGSLNSRNAGINDNHQRIPSGNQGGLSLNLAVNSYREVLSEVRSP